MRTCKSHLKKKVKSLHDTVKALFLSEVVVVVLSTQISVLGIRKYDPFNTKTGSDAIELVCISLRKQTLWQFYDLWHSGACQHNTKQEGDKQ